MTLLPAPLLRGLSVLAIGGAIAISHITFASAGPTKPVQVASASAAVPKMDVTTTGSISADEAFGENCYLELVQEKSARGKTVTRRVHECD
jgi:multidrug efflux pump subunit AcrA (membrane-fusion protein)